MGVFDDMTITKDMKALARERYEEFTRLHLVNRGGIYNGINTDSLKYHVRLYYRPGFVPQKTTLATTAAGTLRRQTTYVTHEGVALPLHLQGQGISHELVPLRTKIDTKEYKASHVLDIRGGRQPGKAKVTYANESPGVNRVWPDGASADAIMITFAPPLTAWGEKEKIAHTILMVVWKDTILWLDPQSFTDRGGAGAFASNLRDVYRNTQYLIDAIDLMYGTNARTFVWTADKEDNKRQRMLIAPKEGEQKLLGFDQMVAILPLKKPEDKKVYLILRNYWSHGAANASCIWNSFHMLLSLLNNQPAQIHDPDIDVKGPVHKQRRAVKTKDNTIRVFNLLARYATNNPTADGTMLYGPLHGTGKRSNVDDFETRKPDMLRYLLSNGEKIPFRISQPGYSVGRPIDDWVTTKFQGWIYDLYSADGSVVLTPFKTKPYNPTAPPTVSAYRQQIIEALQGPGGAAAAAARQETGGAAALQGIGGAAARQGRSGNRDDGAGLMASPAAGRVPRTEAMAARDAGRQAAQNLISEGQSARRRIAAASSRSSARSQVAEAARVERRQAYAERASTERLRLGREAGASPGSPGSPALVRNVTDRSDARINRQAGASPGSPRSPALVRNVTDRSDARINRQAGASPGSPAPDRNVTNRSRARVNRARAEPLTSARSRGSVNPEPAPPGPGRPRTASPGPVALMF